MIPDISHPSSARLVPDRPAGNSYRGTAGVVGVGNGGIDARRPFAFRAAPRPAASDGLAQAEGPDVVSRLLWAFGPIVAPKYVPFLPHAGKAALVPTNHRVGVPAWLGRLVIPMRCLSAGPNDFHRLLRDRVAAPGYQIAITAFSATDRTNFIRDRPDPNPPTTKAT